MTYASKLIGLFWRDLMLYKDHGEPMPPLLLGVTVMSFAIAIFSAVVGPPLLAIVVGCFSLFLLIWHVIFAGEKWGFDSADLMFYTLGAAALIGLVWVRGIQQISFPF